MNLFILHEDPAVSATYHCDKHVIKMILESAQLLCSTLNMLGYDTPYKTTHKNHPCRLVRCVISQHVKRTTQQLCRFKYHFDNVLVTMIRRAYRRVLM